MALPVLFLNITFKDPTQLNVSYCYNTENFYDEHYKALQKLTDHNQKEIEV